MPNKDPKTLPYQAVSSVCQKICLLAESIESACLLSGVDPQYMDPDMVANAARTIGHAADYLIDFEMKGPNGWLHLPELKQQKGVA